MTKVVYNACYGGFGLSEKARSRYKELGGEYFNREGYRSDIDIDRTDPILVKVVEEGKASDAFADLEIRDIPAGAQYRIDEYDGMEYPKMIDEYEWLTA